MEQTELKIEQKEEMRFETALKELEQVTTEMQKSDLTLDKSMELFQRGSELVRICQNKLDEAEQEIRMLVGDQEVEFSHEEKSDVL